MLDRRQLVLSGVFAGVLVGRAQAQLGTVADKPTPGTGGRLALGLAGMAYYLGFCPFLNWYKMGGEYDIVLKTGGVVSGKAVFDGGYADKNTGEIVNPVPPDVAAFSRIFYASPDVVGQNLSHEQWVIEWDGTGICQIGGLTSGGSQNIRPLARSSTFRFGKNPGNTWVTFKITNPTDPPRNVRIHQTRYLPNVANGETFNPDWLAQVRNFGILRFMDWMATNESEITDFSQLADERYFAWGQALNATSGYGPKGGMPLSIICQLANISRCNIHVCIPHLATDACVRSIAEYFRDHLHSGVVVTFEYSNECWNFIFRQTRYCFDQASKLWSRADGTRWYGFRSAQCMRIIRDVFGDRARWRGCIATQTVNPDVTRHALLGVDAFRSNGFFRASSFSVTDLFDEISVTGYFGDVQSSTPINSISQANPAVMTCRSHGYKNGQRLKLFVAVGMTELNNRFVTVENATKDTFELSGVDSTKYSAFVVDDRNYVHPAFLFDLMDESNAKFLADPRSYPTKYTHFNRVVAASWLSGSASGFDTVVSVASLRDKFWPGQKVLADAVGLDLRQYEGGLHFVGDAYLTGYGGNPQFTEFVINTSHTQETANVYAAMYQAFFKIGGHYPAKFVEAGTPGQYGTWGGMRFIPGDDSNPVWVATRESNADR